MVIFSSATWLPGHDSIGGCVKTSRNACYPIARCMLPDKGVHRTRMLHICTHSVLVYHGHHISSDFLEKHLHSGKRDSANLMR